MGKQVMICGVDCRPGGRHCNGYCAGLASEPPAATEEQRLQAAATAAHRALDAAEKAWHEYAGQCEVGPGRTWAFNVYERIRRARCK